MRDCSFRQRLHAMELGVIAILAVLFGTPCVVAQSRALGLDVSAWQGAISSSSWSAMHNANDRDFVFIRSSRGGTAGFYNQSDPNNNQGNNTLSQRYDDPYFVQNITRATAAGLLAGPYHFARPDIVAGTQNSGGIANTGADEADHFIQMAGTWMRPGYLLPVFDLEAGQTERTRNQLAQFSIEFSDRIHEVMGIRPVIYTNGNYANYLQGASSSLQDAVVEAYPVLWPARWPNQSDPDSIPVQTGHPKDTYSPIYGPWDDSPNPTHPWGFWQYASTGRLSGYNNGNSNLDVNVAQGGTEFLKDNLVPALWTGGASGQWTTLANWNSGQAPVAPVQGPGQASRVGPLLLPTARLPGPDDTVILDRAAGAATVTLSSGTQSIRKLVARDPLNITGGVLDIGHVPSADSPGPSALFSAPVAIDGGGVSAHTIEVDPGVSMALAGEIAFHTLNLKSVSGQKPTLEISGDVTLNPLGDQQATIHATGPLSSLGELDLGGNRQWHIGDGAAAVDVSIQTPMVNGSIIKAGPGVLSIGQPTGYSGDVDVREGGLILNNLQLGDAANVSLESGATLSLNRLGTPDVVGQLSINGVPMGVGLYGAAGSGAQFETALISGTGLLQVTSVALAGDYNADGVVDSVDYAVWRDSLGLATPMPNEAASPGIVDSEDFDVWRNNFGAMLSSTSLASTPEPGAWLLAMVGAVGGLRRPAVRPRIEQPRG